MTTDHPDGRHNVDGISLCSNDECIKWFSSDGKTYYKMFENDWSRVESVINPITRSVIKIDPPFHFSTDEELESFIEHVEAYCLAAWNLGYLDPEEISSPYGWVTRSPSMSSPGKTEEDSA